MAAGHLIAFVVDARANHLVNQRWHVVEISSSDASYDSRTDVVAVITTERDPEDRSCGHH